MMVVDVVGVEMDLDLEILCKMQIWRYHCTNSRKKTLDIMTVGVKMVVEVKIVVAKYQNNSSR